MEQRWMKLLFLGVIFAVWGIAVSATFPGDAACFAGFSVLVGLAMIVGSFLIRDRDLGTAKRMEQAREEERRRQIEEIATAVKSTIKVRCRYCGSLNEESSSKCESCGATL